jgi:hypothetical protein
MATPTPRPISPAERRARQNRVVRLARELGFVGRVEYRHVHSRSGGAQYGQAARAADDLLTIYAEAFERDADPADFSLAAIIAHERGHQLLFRHPRLANRVSGQVSIAGEEILASLVGAVISADLNDRRMLAAKAAAELLSLGVSREHAARQIEQLWPLLRAIL